MDREKCAEALRRKGRWTPPQHEVTIKTGPNGERITKDENGVERFYFPPGVHLKPDDDRYVLTLRLENPIIKDGCGDWSVTDEFLETLREYIAAVEARRSLWSDDEVEVVDGERGTRLTVTYACVEDLMENGAAVGTLEPLQREPLADVVRGLYDSLQSSRIEVPRP